MSKNKKASYSHKEELQGKRVLTGIAIAFLLLGALAVAAAFII